ncbi:MAG: type VI secretion system ImpH/TssG family protein [Phenylobacterium sp.]
MGAKALGTIELVIKDQGKDQDKAEKEEKVRLSTTEIQLLQASHQFNFTKAIELLEKSGKDNLPVGFAHPPAKEAVRFRSVVSLGFAAADIDSCHKVSEGLVELSVNFMGLYGPTSPLPAYFTEAVIAEEVEIDAQGDAQSYFLATSDDVLNYQRQQIDFTELEQQAAQKRRQILDGELTVTILDHKQIKGLKRGKSLSLILKENGELEQFKAGQRVLQFCERGPGRQRDFLDIFNHRLISLFYRSTKKYQPYRDYQSGGNDAFSEQIYALMGAPDAKQRQQSALQWPRLLHFAGLLSMKQAAKERIIKVLSGYFGLKQVDVEEGVLRMVDIPPDQLCVLGRDNVALGEDFMLGAQVPDRCGKFRVALQQLDLDTFNDFLPAPANGGGISGQHYQAMNELLQFIKPPELLCDIELALSPEAVPGFSLSSDSKCRLGWSTWLGDTHGQSQSVVVD